MNKIVNKEAGDSSKAPYQTDHNKTQPKRSSAKICSQNSPIYSEMYSKKTPIGPALEEISRYYVGNQFCGARHGDADR
jgi:hypothetical protein